MAVVLIVIDCHVIYTMFAAVRHDVGDTTSMRQDWTLLCAGVTALPSGSIDLKNVITSIRVGDPYRVEADNTVLPIHAPMWIVSQWTAEFDVERRLLSGLLQLIAPSGERVLNQRQLEFDFRHTNVFRYIERIPDMSYAGLGTYEFHVLVSDFAERGEWGRTCLKVT